MVHRNHFCSQSSFEVPIAQKLPDTKDERLLDTELLRQGRVDAHRKFGVET